MPIGGPVPKPRDQIRHRVKPVYEWTEVADVPNEDGPPLPRSPRTVRRFDTPEPGRPLGPAGLELWSRTWSEANSPPDSDVLLVLCEQVDERQRLRRRVFEDDDWRDRNCLRQLDAQVSKGLTTLAAALDQRPKTWPPATKRWWAAVSRLPHTRLWTEADWQFAMDTAYLVGNFHAGNLKLAIEIRTRERIMGTTADFRRALRIRYVSPVDDSAEVDGPSVVAMAAYRKSVGS